MRGTRHLLTDHYGWNGGEGPPTRCQRVGDRMTQATVLADGRVRLTGVASTIVEAEIALDELGLGAGRLTICRVPTLTVWEALATAVLRQVVRADTARQRFARLVSAVGADGAFPGPETVLRCDEREMTALGLRFCWPKLVRLAEWSLQTDAHEQAGTDGGRALLEQAADLSGLGPWSLAVAAWDLSCDPLRYPVGDFVVQAGAARLFTDSRWARKPGEFEAQWREHCGPQIGPLTLLALVAAEPRGARFLDGILDPSAVAA
jgi:DNA-3-methyladenine glycosylase II